MEAAQEQVLELRQEKRGGGPSCVIPRSLIWCVLIH